MGLHHEHSHGRVFHGILPRDGTALDNKLRFIHNAPDANSHTEQKIDIIGEDGKKHVIHKNNGLVHVHEFSKSEKNEVNGPEGKKHVISTNKKLGLVHNLGLSNKQEVDGADGKKHVVVNNNGLVHDLGLAQKQEVEGPNGKKHVVANNNGLVHILGEVDKAAAVETVYSQVYVTESKTFDGPAQYVTVTGTGTTTTPTTGLNSAEAAYQSAKSAANAPDVVADPTSSSAAAPAVTSSTTSYNTKPLQHTRSGADQLKGVPHTTSSTAPTVVGGTPLSQAQSSSSPDASNSKSGGMTAGASAGVAFGVIFALALCGGLIFFCWRRRKQQKDREGAEKLDEKHVSKNSFFGGTAAAPQHPAGDLRRSIQSEKSFTSHSAATAPRLSLRPVTQFLPNIMGGGSNNESARSGPQMSEKKSGWDRTPAGASQNPFADAAVIDEKNARPVSPLNPFDEGDGAVVAAGKKSPSHSSKGSWEGSEPPTPKSTKFGTAAAVPIGAAGQKGAPPPGPNNVHRVQLDFKPSMDDELELKSGQLVRMLHEYDDGWCLCIRMDRSQQGVCPRTCLSKLPVKPRPQGPPPNGPNGARPRGPPPPGMARPQSPAMRDGMVPRPLTPTGRERSQTGPRMSPGHQNGRPRSQSMGGSSERPASPSGMPPRKPVPGMAL